MCCLRHCKVLVLLQKEYKVGKLNCVCSQRIVQECDWQNSENLKLLEFF